MSKTHLPDGISVRWLGHSVFDIAGPGGRKFIFDPYIVQNPAFPKNLGAEVIMRGAYEAILLTHTHQDHSADVLPMLKDDSALKLIAQFEIGEWFKGHGIKDDQVIVMNTGGTLPFGDVRITMVPAVHTNSVMEGNTQRSLGVAIGFVLRFDNGFTIYNTGDTAVTLDMKIVHDLYKPDLVILPIGDFYTMGAEQAAYALHLLKPKFAIGCHFHTWGEMPPGTPEALEKEMAKYDLPTKLIKLKPGESLT